MIDSIKFTIILSCYNYTKCDTFYNSKNEENRLNILILYKTDFHYYFLLVLRVILVHSSRFKIISSITISLS